MVSRFDRLTAGLKSSPAAREPDFLRLSAASVFSAAGMAGEQVILGLLVYRITGSSEWVGISLAVYYLPLCVVGTLSGAVADWTDRRALLRRIEIILVAVQLGLAVLTFGSAPMLWMLLAANVGLGSLRAMQQPVRVSYAYDLIGGAYIVSAIGALNLGVRSGNLLGALLAGSIMETGGTAAAFLALAATHMVAWLLARGLRNPGRAAVLAAQRSPIRRNLAEYLSELRRNHILLMLVLLTAAVELFGFSFQTGLPQLATERFEAGAGGLGQLHAARAAGGVAASLVFAIGPSWAARPGRVYLWVITIFGGAMIFVSGADDFLLALAGLFLVSGMATASDILTQSMLQLSVPNALRGRAMGAWSLAIGIAPVGHMEMGFLIGWLGLGGAYALNGTVMIAIAILVALAVPQLRRI